MNQPFVQQLAAKLGWGKSEFFTHQLTGKSAKDFGTDLIEWAECWVSDNFFMQVNALPQQDENYSLCVYAIRFQICSGWRYTRLTSDYRQRQKVLQEIIPFFEFNRFASAEVRARYRESYPHASGYTWKRGQAEGTPHFTQSIE